MLAPDIILPFDGNHADIPADFVRETSLDGKYPKSSSDSVAPNNTGGSSTHSHTSPTHSHTLQSHTHTGTSGARTGGNTYSTATNTSTGAKLSHTHSYTTGGVNSGGTTGSTAVTYGAVSNDPPYYQMIFIKATKFLKIPANAVVLSKESSRSGLSFHSPSAGKFLKGAGAGANAGGIGGSLTNVHDISHTHTTTTHTHTGGNTGGTASGYESAPSSDGACITTHTHTFSVGSSTQSINSFSGSLTCDETVQPAFKTLNAFKNETGSPVLPDLGDIALWLGSLANIPVGWALCDGQNGTPDMRDKFLKLNSIAGESTTGGSNTHTHASKSHSHTSSGSHTHSVSFGNYTATHREVGSGNNIIGKTHSHETANSNSATANYNSANTSANSANNEPEYRTVAYIQLQFKIGGGSVVTKMLN